MNKAAKLGLSMCTPPELEEILGFGNFLLQCVDPERYPHAKPSFHIFDDGESLVRVGYNPITELSNYLNKYDCPVVEVLGMSGFEASTEHIKARLLELQFLYPSAIVCATVAVDWDTKYQSTYTADNAKLVEELLTGIGWTSVDFGQPNTTKYFLANKGKATEIQHLEG